MRGRDFIDEVEKHKDVRLLGFKEGATEDECEVVVGSSCHSFKWAIKLRAIAEHSWDSLLGVVTGRLEPQLMRHVTRVVGYYSRVANWNRSKLAELNDRRGGNYSVPGAARGE